MDLKNPDDVDIRRTCDGQKKPYFSPVFSAAIRTTLVFFAGTALVVSVVFAVVTGLGSLRSQGPLLFADYEESVEWQMFREREFPNLKLWMSDVGYGRSVMARHFDCVATESPHFQTLLISRGHQGLVIDSGCDPLDFSSVSADEIHQDLVVLPYYIRRDYVATLPGYVPRGDRAIQLRTKWNEYVLINYDILEYLGLVEGSTEQ